MIVHDHDALGGELRHLLLQGYGLVVVAPPRRHLVPVDRVEVFRVLLAQARVVDAARGALARPRLRLASGPAVPARAVAGLRGLGLEGGDGLLGLGQLDAERSDLALRTAASLAILGPSATTAEVMTASMGGRPTPSCPS